MKRLTVAVVALGLVAGVIIGAIIGNPFDGTASAAPPAKDTLVREQNLDADGFIRVHEQGISNVNVVNFPSPSAGRLIELGTQTVGPNQSYQSSLVDVSDCSEMLAMARSTGTGIGFDNRFETSPDGTTVVGAPAPIDVRREQVIDGVGTASAVVRGQGTSTNWTFPSPYRFIRLHVLKAAALETTDITAWIWCAA